MINTWPRWKRWTFAVVAALGLLAVAVASKPVQECIEDYKGHYRSEQPSGIRVPGFVLGATFRCSGHFLHENGEVLVALFTLCLASVTGVLAFFTYRLWQSTGELVRGADTTAQRQLRAYIGVTIKRYRLQDQRVPLSFEIEVKNYGQTPAMRLAVLSMNTCVLPFPPSSTDMLAPYDFPDPDQHEPHRIMLNPGATLSASSSWNLPRIEDEEFAAVAAEAAPHLPHPPLLYCFGTVEFFDVFGKHYWLHFAGMYGGDLTSERPRKQRRAILAPIYNDTGEGPPALAKGKPGDKTGPYDLTHVLTNPPVAPGT